MFSSLDHIDTYLKRFVSDPETDFQILFDNVRNEEKAEYRELFIYLDKVINYSIGKGTIAAPQFTHLHISGPSEHLWHPILEFLCIKFYFRNLLQTHINGNDDKAFFADQITFIDNRVTKPLFIPEGVKGGTRKSDRAQSKRKQDRAIRKFYDELRHLIDPGISQYVPRTLINMLKKEKDRIIEDRFQTRKFAVSIDGLDFRNNSLKNVSYVVLNSDLNRKTIDEMQLPNAPNIIDGLTNVILFDCEGRNIHTQFNHTAIKQLNNEGAGIKDLLILTFDKGVFRANHLLSNIEKINSKYHIKDSTDGIPDSYIILPEEIELLLKGERLSKIGIDFIGEHTRAVHQFAEAIGEYEDIYELFSIRMRSIFSLCTSHEFKDLLIKDVFSLVQGSKLLSKNTQTAIADLDPKIRDEIRILMGEMLSAAMEANLKQSIKQFISVPKSVVVIPDSVLTNTQLLRQLRKDLDGASNISFSNWTKVLDTHAKNILILDYRDTGISKYRIYPNITETRFGKEQKAQAIFLSMFFKHNYERTLAQYNSVIRDKLTKHPIRREHFKFEIVPTENNVDSVKDSDQDMLWDLDNSYNASFDRDSIVITYRSNSRKSYYPSQLFIAKSGEDDTLFVAKAEDMVMPNHVGLLVQTLDSLYEGLNLFEVTESEEAELSELAKKFAMRDATTLWKVLLKREVIKQGMEVVYDHLLNASNAIGGPMVSSHHFQSSWLDHESDLLIPRSKRVFKVVCDFLDLPNLYFRTMLKKRARERLLSRKSNNKMNRLIADLIHERMFDSSGATTLQQLEHLDERHDMDDIGITSENIATEIQALVHLLRSNLSLEEVQNIELRQP